MCFGKMYFRKHSIQFKNWMMNFDYDNPSLVSGYDGVPDFFRLLLDLVHSRLSPDTPSSFPRMIPPHVCSSPRTTHINDCTCIYKHIQSEHCCPSIYEFDISNRKTTGRETNNDSVECRRDKEALLLLALGDQKHTLTWAVKTCKRTLSIHRSIVKSATLSSSDTFINILDLLPNVILATYIFISWTMIRFLTVCYGWLSFMVYTMVSCFSHLKLHDLSVLFTVYSNSNLKADQSGGNLKEFIFAIAWQIMAHSYVD